MSSIPSPPGYGGEGTSSAGISKIPIPSTKGMDAAHAAQALAGFAADMDEKKSYAEKMRNVPLAQVAMFGRAASEAKMLASLFVRKAEVDITDQSKTADEEAKRREFVAEGNAFLAEKGQPLQKNLVKPSNFNEAAPTYVDAIYEPYKEKGALAARLDTLKDTESVELAYEKGRHTAEIRQQHQSDIASAMAEGFREELGLEPGAYNDTYLSRMGRTLVQEKAQADLEEIKRTSKTTHDQMGEIHSRMSAFLAAAREADGEHARLYKMAGDEETPDSLKAKSRAEAKRAAYDVYEKMLPKIGAQAPVGGSAKMGSAMESPAESPADRAKRILGGG